MSRLVRHSASAPRPLFAELFRRVHRGIAVCQKNRRKRAALPRASRPFRVQDDPEFLTPGHREPFSLPVEREALPAISEAAGRGAAVAERKRKGKGEYSPHHVASSHASSFMRSWERGSRWVRFTPSSGSFGFSFPLGAPRCFLFAVLAALFLSPSLSASVGSLIRSPCSLVFVFAFLLRPPFAGVSSPET